MALTLLATNNAESTLASAISATDTSLIVSAGTGAEFPSVEEGISYFKLTIIDAATGSQVEIVNVTAKTGDIFTIERAQEGTLARAWAANDFAANMMTADTLNVIAQYTQQAGESAAQAGEYAENASEYAKNKFTFYKTATDPDGTIAGLADTTDGQSFWVAQGPDALSAAWQYQNKAGVAVLQAKQPGTAAVTGTIREFPTLALAQGQADTGNILIGAKCWVTSAADISLADEYINNGGTLEATGRVMISQGYVDSLIQDNDVNDLILRVRDANGWTAMEIFKTLINHPNITIDVSAETNDFIVKDPNGFIAISAKQLNEKLNSIDDEIYELKNSPVIPVNIISKLDAEALAYSQNVNNTVVTGIQRPVFDYNIIITYGQSLSTANEGWPALSKIAQEVGNVLMFGQSVRGLDRLVANWRPVGGPSLQDLIAVVQQRDTVDSLVLTDAEVAALPVGAQNEGESFDVGATNFWRSLQNDFHGVAANPDRKIVVLNCGVAGQTVEQLSKGASPELFSRVGIALNQLKTHINTVSPGATLGVVCISYDQGQYNYNGSAGGTQDKTTFLNITKKLKTDLDTEVMGITGQKLPPAFLISQTSGSWTVDSTNMSIGNAQTEMANTVPGVWLVASDYFVTDKAGHLDPNGYRWLGMFYGKLMHRILDRGIDWKPLQPLSAVYSGREIYINFHVPNPPLQFKDAYDVTTAQLYANKGFRVTSGSNQMTVSSVEIVGVSTVRLTLSDNVPAGAQVWYASKTTFNGNGNLCDSDRTISTYNYEYQAGTGQYPSANIAALVGKPYPQNNFCVAFTKIVTAYED
ncbi:TPA: SwmB domain-containing protein [Raoultella ornithinolytica]